MAFKNLQLQKDEFPIKIIEWKITTGDTVSKDQVIGVYSNIKSQTLSLKSPCVGEISEILIPQGQLCQTQTTLCVISEKCTHAVVLQGLCAVCGRDLSDSGDYISTANINMMHDNSGITVSLDEAKRIENQTTQRLLKQKKLSLILDLDQTIVHAAVDIRIGEWMRNPLHPNHALVNDVHTFMLPDSPIEYFIKLRPGTRLFLSEISKIFEMHIYTMGTRNYADAIAKIIDPDKNLFKERILSRDESGSFTIKSIQRLFPCNQNMVAVVDDRGIGDINAPLPKTTTESNIENLDSSKNISLESPKQSESPGYIQADSDEELQRVKNLLIHIHQCFYNGDYEQDVGKIIPDIRKTILKDVVIAFSGVIPLGVDPTKNELWQIANSFGAKIQETIDDNITHLIAAKRGTLKVNQARKIPGIYILQPEWLLKTSSLWERANEIEYLIEAFIEMPAHMPREQLKVMIKSNTASSENLFADENDYAILSGKYDKTITPLFEPDDWLDMSREVEEAMNEEDSQTSNNSRDSIDDEIEEGLEELLSADEHSPILLPENYSDLKRKRPIDDNQSSK